MTIVIVILIQLPYILDDRLHDKLKLLIQPKLGNFRNIIQGCFEGFVDWDNRIINEF